jgi:POT family proton-dependent oligopeptide transporter
MAAALLQTPHVFNILVAEAAERFTYYSTRSSLIDLFTNQFHFGDAVAVSIVSFWSALCYISPILGASLADGIWGRYDTILRGLILYIVSVAALAAGASLVSAPLAICSLVGVALASGGIKPCVAPFGADQLTATMGATITSYYFIFYAAINLGSCIAYFTISAEVRALGYGGAYAICAGAVVAATMLFVLPRSIYVRSPPGRSAFLAVLRVLLAAARLKSCCAVRCCRGVYDGEAHALISAEKVEKGADSRSRLAGSSWLHAARGAPGVLDNDVDEAAALGRLLPIFSALPFFWAVYDSYGTVWQLQARRMNLCIASTWCIEPLQMGIANALLILLLVPVFDGLIVPKMRRAAERRPWLEPSPLRRMTTGMFVAAGAFAVSGILEERINAVGDGVINVAEQLPQYVLLAVAEVLVSTTGLEFAFVEAGPTLKSAVLAMFFLTTAAGDVLTGALYAVLGGLPAATLIWIVTALQVLAAGFFAAVARVYVPRALEDAWAKDDRGGEQTLPLDSAQL